jgi:hypothetical protein
MAVEAPTELEAVPLREAAVPEAPQDSEAALLRGGRLLSRGFRPFRLLESSIIPATCPNR